MSIGQSHELVLGVRQTCNILEHIGRRVQDSVKAWFLGNGVVSEEGLFSGPNLGKHILIPSEEYTTEARGWIGESS